MNYVFSFEKMRMWTDVKMYVKTVYDITKNYPHHETYGLQSQLQRAAVSVASNIAEGLSRKTDKEQLRFVEIAYSSLIETYAQLVISEELGYIEESQLAQIKNEVFKISNQLNALTRTINKRISD
jgi:four helix bundle protein